MLESVTLLVLCASFSVISHHIDHVHSGKSLSLSTPLLKSTPSLPFAYVSNDPNKLCKNAFDWTKYEKQKITSNQKLPLILPSLGFPLIYFRVHGDGDMTFVYLSRKIAR